MINSSSEHIITWHDFRVGDTIRLGGELGLSSKHLDIDPPFYSYQCDKDAVYAMHPRTGVCADNYDIIIFMGSCRIKIHDSWNTLDHRRDVLLFLIMGRLYWTHPAQLDEIHMTILNRI